MLFCLYQSAKDEAAAAVEQLREAESEAKALRSMTHRMILTQEELVFTLYHYGDFIVSNAL